MKKNPYPNIIIRYIFFLTHNFIVVVNCEATQRNKTSDNGHQQQQQQKEKKFKIYEKL